jgi:hypothetical protein
VTWMQLYEQLRLKDTSRVTVDDCTDDLRLGSSAGRTAKSADDWTVWAVFHDTPWVCGDPLDQADAAMPCSKMLQVVYAWHR